MYGYLWGGARWGVFSPQYVCSIGTSALLIGKNDSGIFWCSSLCGFPNLVDKFCAGQYVVVARSELSFVVLF